MVKPSETERTRLGTRAGGESVFNGDRASVWEDEKVLEMDGGVNVLKVQCKCKVLNATELCPQKIYKQ